MRKIYCFYPVSIAYKLSQCEMGTRMIFLDKTEIEIKEVNIDSPLDGRCVIAGNKLLSVRNESASSTENHASVFERLGHHANVLNPIFPINISDGENFVVVENFKGLLDETFFPSNFKTFVQQVCNGLSHCHKLGIVFLPFVESNIIEYTIDNVSGKPIHYYKIVNMGNAIFFIDNSKRPNSDNCSTLKRQNINELGSLLRKFHQNFLLKELNQKKALKDRNKQPSRFRAFDEACLSDLIDNMLEEHCEMMPSILDHPFFWSIHESLMFIVEIVKMLEPLAFPAIDKKLAYCKSKILHHVEDDQIIVVDWRNSAKTIVNHIHKKKGKKPHESVFGLLKTIRNLASIITNKYSSNGSKYFHYLGLS